MEARRRDGQCGDRATGGCARPRPRRPAWGHAGDVGPAHRRDGRYRAGTRRVASVRRNVQGALRRLDRRRGEHVRVWRASGACSARQCVPSGEHDAHRVSRDEVEGRRVRHSVRRNGHERVQRSVRLVCMTASVAPVDRPALRLTRETVVILGVAALAWAGVIAYAAHMGNGVGTMGMSLLEFMGMWSPMMTAMMLPAIAPVASLYLRTMVSNRPRRLALFVGGYLIVWAVVGIPTYVALRIVDGRVADSPATMRTIAVVVLAAAGMYQLTPLKAVCLRHCRSPLAQLLHYGNIKGRGKDLKVALHHAGFCLGCCWALMALFVAFGVMNLWAMLGLAVIAFTEKLLPRGETIGRFVGAAFIVLAVLVATSPRVAEAIVPSPTAPMTEM